MSSNPAGGGFRELRDRIGGIVEKVLERIVLGCWIACSQSAELVALEVGKR